MKLNILFRGLVLISILLTSCFGFDTNTNDNIIGKYKVSAIDDSEESLWIDNTLLVETSLYEVLWNKQFILAKQHPESDARKMAYGHIRFKIWRDTIQKMKLKNYTKVYSDSSLNNWVDKTAGIDFQRRLQSDELSFLNKTKDSEVTFYYLIEIKRNPESPLVFFREDSLNNYMTKYKVGKLVNKKTY